MDDFKNEIKKDPHVQIKIKDFLNKYNRLTYNYQSKIGYGTLTQNVIFKELINIKGATRRDVDIELKMKISRRNYLESKML